jgi:YHS domain-containing protein
MGWRFTLAEFVGGIFLILLMWGALHVLVPRRREEELRAHAQTAETGHAHPTATDVALNFRADIQMLWKELVAGFVIAGYVSLLPRGFFNGLFITHAWAPLRLAENVLVGPLVAALAFVCSIGNVPLAAVLWGGGISFSGVIAFLYADLIIVPIVVAYTKYYGRRAAALLTGVMFGAMVVASLAVDGVFSLFGLVPHHRPDIASIAERPVTWNYTSVLDILFALVFVALIALTLRRGAKDPVCGMTVDRRGDNLTSQHERRTYFFCGAHCKHTFDADPEAYT